MKNPSMSVCESPRDKHTTNIENNATNIQNGKEEKEKDIEILEKIGRFNGEIIMNIKIPNA